MSVLQAVLRATWREQCNNDLEFSTMRSLETEGTFDRETDASTLRDFRTKATVQ